VVVDTPIAVFVPISALDAPIAAFDAPTVVIGVPLLAFDMPILAFDAPIVAFRCACIGVRCAYIGIPSFMRPMFAWRHAGACMHDPVFASTSGSVRRHTMTALFLEHQWHSNFLDLDLQFPTPFLLDHDEGKNLPERLPNSRLLLGWLQCVLCHQTAMKPTVL